MDTIRKDPALANWPEENKQFEDMLREFLAGETGYVTMPWYSPIELSNRAVVLDRIVEAAKAFLASVLTKQQSNHPQILLLKKWLHELKPQPDVIGLASVTCKICRQHAEGIV